MKWCRAALGAPYPGARSIGIIAICEMHGGSIVGEQFLVDIDSTVAGLAELKAHSIPELTKTQSRSGLSVITSEANWGIYQVCQ